MARLTSLLIDPEAVVGYLKHEIKLKSIYQEILARQIVGHAAEERGIIVAPDEIQAEADQFRYEHKLESASQTFEWLDDQLISPDDWEEGIQERLLTKK